jgi:hypothetical protein
MADREVNVVLTRVPQECGHDLWSVEIDGNRLPGATTEDDVHRVVDCYLWGRRVRDLVDNDKA